MNVTDEEKIMLTPSKATQESKMNTTPLKGTPRKDYSSCEVCKESFDGGDFLILPCRHSYHRSCLSANYTVHVVMGNTASLFACPLGTCRNVIPQSIIDSFEEQRLSTASSKSKEDYEAVEDVKGSSPRYGRHSKTLIEHCGICNESLHILPTYELPCNHVFHKECLKLRYPFRLHYGQNHANTCPMKSCRQAVSIDIIQTIARF